VGKGSNGIEEAPRGEEQREGREDGNKLQSFF